MPLLIPSFILIRPQMGENIGAAARAMLNFGQTDLRLVSPRDSWPNQAAIDMAAGALDHVKVSLYQSLSDAAGDLHYLFATTARPREVVKPVHSARSATSDMKSRMGLGQKIGFVFGPERTGLENHDIMLCHAILTIPSSPFSPCLNLAQSVALLAYECFTATENTEDIALKSHIPAPLNTMNDVLTRLENELEEKGFFKADHLKPSMVRNIRAMLMRGEWTEQEIRTFHGIISAFKETKSNLHNK